jgi:signal transduction histidine kinase
VAAWTVPSEPRPASTVDPRQLKEEFLATVSHELRTPLNAILGWTELLRMRPTPAPQVDRGLEVIERNARRQLALVEELLVAAEGSAPAEHWGPIDVRVLLRTIVDSLAGHAESARVALVDDAAAALDADAAPVWVHGDEASLHTALRHIVDNAIKFTPAGGAVRTSLGRSGDRVMLFVSDSGPGIESSKVEEMFEPFRQHDGSATRVHGGLGLGLTIARKLIERHGGHLDLRSESAGGSTCLVTLPLRPTRA